MDSDLKIQIVAQLKLSNLTMENCAVSRQFLILYELIQSIVFLEMSESLDRSAISRRSVRKSSDY